MFKYFMKKIAISARKEKNSYLIVLSLNVFGKTITREIPARELLGESIDVIKFLKGKI